MPTIGGVSKALERGQRLGCEAIQLFVKNNMQWEGRDPSAAELERFAVRRKALGDVPVFGHAGYLINLATDNAVNRERSVQSLIREIRIASKLGLPFLVLHPGSRRGQTESEGIRSIISALNEVLDATSDAEVKIALENTAGQGTAIGYTVDQLLSIFEGVRQQSRVGLCLDTAHFFAAGYDIRDQRVWDKILCQFETSVGLDKVLACHLNDSKANLGSRVDRHAGIGQGRIGREAFRHIVNEPRFHQLPACIETPKSPDLHEDLENLAILRSLRMSVPQTTARKCSARKIKKTNTERNSYGFRA